MTLPDGTITTGVFHFDDEDAQSGTTDLVLTFGGRSFAATSEIGFFDAMCRIREQLDREGILLRCFGASENVFPSPMIESMGDGDRAYKLRIGRPARTSDLVCIFDTAEDVIPSRVDQQREFYESWLKSL